MRRMTAGPMALVLCAGAAWGGSVTLEYEEPLRRAWAREAITFRTEVPRQHFDTERMYVTDEAGATVPAQFSDPVLQQEHSRIPITVTLIADFDPWQKRTWTLHYGNGQQPKPPATALVTGCTEGVCILANDRVAVRMLCGEKQFAQPVPAGRVPAPILAVRGPSGEWLGRGWLESSRRVTGYRITHEEDGPIFKTVRAAYDFEGGYYVCTVTLRTGEDILHIREEFDLGPPSADRDSHFCFALTPGLEPDTVRWYGRYHDERFNPSKAPVVDYNIQKEAVFPVDYTKPERMLRLHGLFVWWPQAACYYGAYRADEPASDLVAVFARFPGNWANPTAIFLETTADGELVIKAPIRQPVQDWNVDGVDYRSPYYTGTVADGMQRSFGAREWGMLVARAGDVVPEADAFAASGIRKAWTRYGQNPLDKIKGWTLQWDGMPPASYPIGHIRRDMLPALRARVEQDADLRSHIDDYNRNLFRYLVHQDPELGRELIRRDEGDKHRRGLLPTLRQGVGYYLDTEGDLGVHTFMHHGIGLSRSVLDRYDVAMGVESMTADEAREARALYAFLLYKLSDPDWLAYGTGFHLGNPNMPTAALSVLGQGAALIPGHPMSYRWTMRSVQNMTDMLRDYTSPGGAWRECPHYQMDASIRFVIQAADILRNAGFMDLYRNPYLKSTMLYGAQVMTAVDPRLGVRTLPAIGNGSHEPISHFGRMAAGTATSDPEYSSWMQWAWQEMGSLYWHENDELSIDASLPARPPDMSSRHFPGFGTVMRSHFDDPNETYLVFRMGRNHEHYENDQGSIILYSKGAPLVLDFGSIYQPTMLRPWMHNRVSIDHKVDWLNTGEVEENDLLESADGALGRLTVDRLFTVPEDPLEKMAPNSPAPSVGIDPVTWTRQVLMVKNETADGPHYVVLRDGFQGTGGEFTEFSLWSLATGVEADGNRAHYPGQEGVDLTVTVLDPAKPQFATGKYGHTFLYAPVAHFWRPLHPDQKFEEVQHYIRLKRTDRGGYLAVLYPHRPGEVVPEFKPWADGAGVTAGVGGETHTAICASEPGTFTSNGITLEGQRALVRQAGDRRVLALLSGSSLTAGEFGLSGAAPVAVTVEGDRVTGEANLAVAGQVQIVLPDVDSIGRAVVTAGAEVVVDIMGDWLGAVTLSLPAGRSRFELRKHATPAGT